MKHTHYTIIALLSILLFSCDQTVTQEYTDITEDPLFIEYTNEMETLVVNVQPKVNQTNNLPKTRLIKNLNSQMI